MTVESDETQHVFEVQVSLAGLDPDAVCVELYAEGTNGDGPFRQKMSYVRRLECSISGQCYRGSVSAGRPMTDYTARIIPHQAGVAVPLEASYILWQR